MDREIKITAEAEKAQVSFAETLVDTLCMAISEMLAHVAASRTNDVAKAGKAVDKARADLIQALTVPKQVEEDEGKLRDEIFLAMIPSLMTRYKEEAYSDLGAIREAWQLANHALAARKAV